MFVYVCHTNKQIMSTSSGESCDQEDATRVQNSTGQKQHVVFVKVRKGQHVSRGQHVRFCVTIVRKKEIKYQNRNS